MQKPMVFIEMT